MEKNIELAKHVEVDMYGNCGKLKCLNKTEYFQMLNNDYKFYLAFENSNYRNVQQKNYLRIHYAENIDIALF